MNYIEIIGPAGVGKSTLLEKLANKSKKGTRWKRYEEAVLDIIDSFEWRQLKNTKSKVLYLAYKLNFTGYKKLGIRNTLIKELTSDISQNIQKKYEYLIESQFKALASLDKNISPINKCTLLNWHVKALDKLFVLEALQYRKTVVFDEGPFKTHFNLHQIDLEQIKESTLPRAVIYCFCSFEENLKRVKKRISLTGQINKIHNKLNNKDLEYLVAYTQEIVAKNIAFIENIGLPILKIDLTNPIESADLKKLINFLEKYSMTKTPSLNTRNLFTSKEYCF